LSQDTAAYSREIWDFTFLPLRKLFHLTNSFNPLQFNSYIAEKLNKTENSQILTIYVNIAFKNIRTKAGKEVVQETAKQKTQSDQKTMLNIT